MTTKTIELQRKHLMEAFQYDCQTLLTRFELTYNTHFQNFCEIWREMQFSLIFDCQPSKSVLIVFYKNALHVTKQFLINASGLKERIGALYLMYSVYYMVRSDEAKIRMTLSDWKCLMDLHQQVKVEEYLDANYILCKLIVDCAFIHCISDNEYGIEKHFHKSKSKPLLDYYNILPEIKDLAAPGKLLSTINSLSKLYEEKKRTFVGEQDISSVQLYDANMANDFINCIRTMQAETRIFSKNTFDENTCSNEPRPSTSASSELASLSTSELASTSASTSASALASASVSASASASTSASVSASASASASLLMSMPILVSSSSSTVPTSASNNQENNKVKKRRIRRRKKLILAKMGHAFETALRSESEEEMEIESDSDPLQGV